VTEAQLAIPNAIVTSNGFMAGYGYDISRRTQFQAVVQYDNLIFNDSQPAIPPPNAVEETLLHGTGTFAFHTSLSRLLSHADSLGISSGYSRQVNGAEQSQTISLHGTWKRPLSVTYVLAAEGGVDLYTTDRLTGVNYAPTGSVAVSRKVRRSGSIAVRLAQTIEVLGATHVSTSINVDGGVKIGKNLTIGATGSFVHNDFPGNPAYNYSPLIVGANLSYKLPANLVVSASYSDWERISGGDSSFLAARSTIYKTVSLSYARTWH